MAKPIRVQIKRVVDTMNKGISRAVGEAAFSAFQAVVIASPVDTGNFRGNWQVALHTPSLNTLSGEDFSAGEVIGSAQPLFDRYEMATGGQPNIIFFSNNVPYARRLNQGHSQQAPAGFVQKAIRAGLDNLGAKGRIFT
jgi:hypothetical protein